MHFYFLALLLVCIVARATAEELSCVVEQLEQDRVVASKRARRLQDDLKKAQQVGPPSSGYSSVAHTCSLERTVTIIHPCVCMAIFIESLGDFWTLSLCKRSLI